MSIRTLIAFLFLLSLSFAHAQQSSFAALEVVPNGPQAFDIATGISTLAEGGRVIDHESGVTLSGGFIRYKEGEFVELEDALVEGGFGVIEAPGIRFDIAAQTLSASGGVRFAGSDLTLSARELTIHLEPRVAVARGEVTGQTPPLEAAAVVVDIAEHTALLVGPYRYQDGPFTLTSEVEGDLLSLNWQAPAEAEGKVAFEASTEIAPARLEALEPYLP